MLGQRILTAVVLLCVLVPAVLASSPWPFDVIVGVAAAAAMWEWTRIATGATGATGGMAGSLAAGLAMVLALVGIAGVGVPQAGLLFQGVALLATLLGLLALRAGPQGWAGLPQGLHLAVGAVLIFFGAWAMMLARRAGLGFLMSVFVLVWVADSFAYFGGRALGRRKLAPSISPGKSWEGAAVGALAVLVLAVAWTRLDATGTNLFTRLQGHWGWPGLVLLTLLLTAVSIMGDLFESLVKRAAGVKDSSRLLPGHGGVLDRIDALLPVFPWAVGLAAWSP